MVIDTDGVVQNAPILSTKEICQDTTNTVATTAARASPSKESLGSLATVSQPVTLSGSEEVGLNAIEYDSLPEVNIASHLSEAVEEGVQISAPEAQHELDNAADQQSSHPLDLEITGTVVSTETPDGVKFDAGPVEDTSKVSITEALNITEVKDINVIQDSSVFASGENNGDIQLPPAEETDRDTAVDGPSIPAEAGVELHEETLSPGNEAGIVDESDVPSTTAPELILGDGNTTNERSADEQPQDIAEISTAEHVSVAPESINEVVTFASAEIHSDKGEISLEQEVVSVASPPVVEEVLSKTPSETVKIAVAYEAEKPPTVADAIQVSKLETPSPEVHVVEIEAVPIDPSLNEELIETVAAHKVDAAILPVTNISETGDIAADGLGISSEIVDASNADVQDIPLESISQVVQEEQFVRESCNGPDETSLPLEGDILDHALEVETLPAETLVDVAEPAPTHAIELPDTANGVAEAAGHALVDLHSAVDVHHTVAVVEEVVVDDLETQATPVVATELSENMEVVLVEEALVNTQPILDDDVVVMDTSSVSEAEAGGPDEFNSNENASLKAELQATQIFSGDADVSKATVPEDLLVEKLEVEGISDTKKVSLDNGDCIQESQVASDSEFSEPPADARAAPVTAVFMDEQTVQIAEHDTDVTEPTLAEQGEVLETVDLTIAQPLSNEFATDATAADRSNVRAKTSATAPSEDGLAGEAKEHAQDLQDDSQVTTVIEEGKVKLEAGVATKEEQSETQSKDSFSPTEIDNSSTHSQPSADQVANLTSTRPTSDQIFFEIQPSEEVATNIVTPGVVPLANARADTEERIQETVTEVSVSQMESVIEGKMPLEEPAADVNVPQEESVPNVNVPQEEPVTKDSLLQEESVVEGSAPQGEPITEANVPQEELAIEVVPQQEAITQVDAPQEELVTSKDDPASANAQVEEVVVAEKSAPILEEVVSAPTLAEELAVSELASEKGDIATSEEVEEQLESSVPLIKEESPAFDIGIVSDEQSNPPFSAEPVNGVAPVPLLEPPVVPTHSADLAKPNHQESEAQVHAANTVSAIEPSETPVVEESILQHQDSVVEVQVLVDLTATEASEAQIAVDSVVEPPATENVESSTLSFEHKGNDTEPSADGITNSEELPSAANDPPLLNTDVISIDSTSDEPSGPESPVDVVEQGTITPKELLTAPAIQVESSETVQTDNEAPLDDSQLPARPWTPSYSVHSQGTPLVTAKELNEESDVPLDDVPSAELWTPSYSVHSQGTPLVTAKELDNEDADDLVDYSRSVDAYEPKLEETTFAKTEQPEASPDSQPDEPQIQDGGPPPQYDPKEETRELLGAVNHLETELNLVTKKEISTSEIISDEQNKPETGMGTSRDIPTVVTEETSTDEVKQPVDQLEGRSHSPSWVPSYLVSTQGSPLPELRELQAIVEAGSPMLSMDEPITSQDSFEAAQSTAEHLHTAVIPVSVPPISIELSTDEDHVQNERLGSEQCLDEPTIHGQLSDIPIPLLIPCMDAHDSQKDTWTPSYSVTTQGVAQSHVEIIDVSPGSSSAAIEPLAHDSDKPSPSLASDISNHALAAVNEQTSSDVFQSDIFDQLATGQPTHPSDLVFEPRLASTGDETPTQTAVVLDKDIVVDVETPADGLSHHIFPSADDTPREGALDSKDKPIVPRLVPLEEWSNDTLHPEPSARKRLESTTSSRFFPGGWFSSSSTKSPDESRPSLELAQGEFIPTKSPADGTEANVSAVSPATTESFGDAREADSASSEEKRKWCIIM